MLKDEINGVHSDQLREFYDAVDSLSLGVNKARKVRLQ